MPSANENYVKLPPLFEGIVKCNFYIKFNNIFLNYKIYIRSGIYGRKISSKIYFVFFSYLLVYIAAYPILFILVMATDDPTVSHDWFNVTWYIFSVVVTILGVWISNVIFNGSVNFKKIQNILGLYLSVI
uniref:Uncharacterized protein n=1 Tax=Bacillus cereus VPC1401 TaxID=870739 RepID=E5AK36_BACCE|nr:hypothetical protein [Bacillus cereus]CBW44176.1 hypothetical protein pLVP1401_25 [Bacillus cereus VPC1401]